MSKKIKITEAQLQKLMTKKNIKEQSVNDMGDGSQEPIDTPDAAPVPDESEQDQPATLETIFAKLKEIQAELEPFVKGDDEDAVPGGDETDMGGDNFGNQQDGVSGHEMQESVKKIKDQFKRFL